MKKVIAVLIALCMLIIPSFDASTNVVLIQPLQKANNVFGRNVVATKTINFEKEAVGFTTAAATPYGFLDAVNETSIGGWAWRSDIPNTPIEVHIYIKQNATGDEWGYSTMAEGYRPDLANAGYGNGYHAFSKPISWMAWKPGTYTIRAFAIGADGNNPQLYSSPKYYTVRNITGNIEYVSSIGVGGWAWKSSAPNEPVTIHVYIRKTNGELLDVFPTTANQARPDLLESGYGNGEHGFTVPIDWSSLPEENLNVTVYAVDGSGYHPAIYNGYYDNRKAISLTGMTDEDGHDFSSWINSTVKGYCENIGCSEFIKYIGANASGLIQIINQSSFAAISTHGSATSISWCLYPNDPENTERGYLTSYDLESLPDDYFDSTRCLLLDACLTGYGGALNTQNLVNTFHRKGIWTVVGFQEETTFYYYTETNEVIPDQGNKLWATEFTKELGNGKSVSEAVECALTAVAYKHGSSNLCGLDSVYIAGNANQIVKH